MGIKQLNRFLREKCSLKSIHNFHLRELKNKTLVVDISIYLYKFISENALMENMYLLLSIFKEYNITPVFIFDGKPPPEKRELLKRRYMDKKEAEQKYLDLETKKNDDSLSDEQMKKIVSDMVLLKKQFIRVKDEDVKNVKDLIKAFGMVYFDAQGEADVLCAILNKVGKAWGCLSDDMDMFLYGCSFVVRNISILKHTAILYDTDSILVDLNMSEKEFCEIMVLSGTDYNMKSETNLNETMRWFHKYKKSPEELEFYQWLIKNTKYINDYSLLLKIYQLFQITDNDEVNYWKTVEIANKKVDRRVIFGIMKKEGFIFI